MTKWQRETLQSLVGCTVGGICGQFSAVAFNCGPGTIEAFAAGFGVTIVPMVVSMYATSHLLTKYDKQIGLKIEQITKNDDRHQFYLP